MTVRQRGAVILGVLAILFGVASPITLTEVFPDLHLAVAALLVWGLALVSGSLGAAVARRSAHSAWLPVRTSVRTYVGLGALASTIGLILGRQSFRGEDSMMAIIVAGLVSLLTFLSVFGWVRGALDKESRSKAKLER